MTDTKPDADAVRQWGGHTAAEVADLVDMLANQVRRGQGIHSEDEFVAILTRARGCIRDQIALLNAQAQEIARLRAVGGGLTTNEINAIAGRVNNLRGELAVARSERGEIAKVLAELMMEWNAVLAERDAARAEVERLQKENRFAVTMKNEMAKAREERDAALKDAQEMKLALREIERLREDAARYVELNHARAFGSDATMSFATAASAAAASLLLSRVW